MAKNTKDRLHVDILRPLGERTSLLARSIHWVTTTGRYIVIVVEMIVIVAFLSRFKLDADLAALQDPINRQVAFIQSLKKQEDLIRQTQFQLQSVNQIQAQVPNYTAHIAKIAQLTPQTIKLANVDFDQTQSFPKTDLTISGQSPSTIELSAFMRVLQKEADFEEITLTNITFDRQTVIFTITGKLANNGGKSS